MVDDSVSLRRKEDQNPLRVSSIAFLIHLIVWTAATVGCESQSKQLEEASVLDTWLVRTITDEGVKQAIIAQHVIYPYHFVPGSEKLNELGKLDLAILVRHYREQPGQLSVRRGEVNEELYEARVKWVRGILKKAGVETEAVQISDALPGGKGISSEQAIRILERASDASTGISPQSAASGMRDRRGAR